MHNGQRTARPTVQLTLNGCEVAALAGEPLIEVLRAHGVKLPTLCYHPSLAAYGACRLCLVELTADGRTLLVPSCSIPAAAGMAIRTDAENAVRARKVSMQLILARCPEVKSLWDFAARMGVTDTPFERGTDDCIMCGLCERVCRELVHKAAIAMSGRGAEREVGSPFDAQSDDCIGCGACVAVCPTGKVRTRALDGYQVMETWHTRLEMAVCDRCGEAFAPLRLIEHVKKVAAPLGISVALCPRCRTRTTVAKMRASAPRGMQAASASFSSGITRVSGREE